MRYWYFKLDYKIRNFELYCWWIMLGFFNFFIGFMSKGFEIGCMIYSLFLKKLKGYLVIRKVVELLMVIVCILDKEWFFWKKVFFLMNMLLN